MTVRKKLLLTTAVLLACAVVFLFALNHSSRPTSVGHVLAPVTMPDGSEIVRMPRTSPGPGPVTGVVYEVVKNGLLVRSGGRSIPPPVQEEKTTEEGAEAEWAEVVTSLEQPVTGLQKKDLQVRFRRAFGRLPRTRRAEALQAAMNLIPDENSAVVIGLVFDRGQSEEIVNLAFSNVLNRSDEIKADVIRRVARDRTHPNYVEAARLNDILCLGSSHEQR